MNKFFSLSGFVLFFVCAAVTADARDCPGCTCSVECHRNGVCKTVCRDSCGQFCFAGEMNYTPTSTTRPGAAPVGGVCPGSHPVKGNFSTYDGSRCIAHRPGGNYYSRTRPERCYSTMEDAVADGCRPAKK